MNPENPIDPRQALEPSLTALLLGELPDDQARFVRQAIASDPELAKTFERVKKASELIRETEAQPRMESAAPPAAPKLNEARRQELLARFKTIQPAQFKPAPRSRYSRVLSVAAAIALLLIVASALLPALVRSKSKSMAQRRAFDGDELLRRKLITASSELEAAPKLSISKPVDKFDVAQLGRKQTHSAEIFTADKSSSLGAQSQRSAQAAFRETIVLPSEGKQEVETLSAGVDRAARDLSLGVPAQAPATAAILGVNERRETTELSYVEATDGIAGASQPAQQQVLTLGDVPLVGRQFSILAKDAEKTKANRGDEIALERSLKEAELATGQPQQPQPDSKSAGGGFGGGYLLTEGTKSAGKEIKAQFDDVASIPTVTNFGLEPQSLATAKVPSPEAGAAFRKRYGRPELEIDQKLALAGPSGGSDKGGAPKNEPAKIDGRVEELKREGGADSREKGLNALVEARVDLADVGAPKPASVPPVAQPEVQAGENAFSTFSLNVSDVSFKLAAASLEKGVLPDPATIRSEEFINAFDYRDAAPASGQPVGFAWDRAQYPFSQNREILRFSVKTAAAGRTQGQPLNIVLLLDNSGSMERADRVRIIHEALRVLATQLQAQDKLSVVTFARTARLWVDGVAGNQAGRVADELSGLTPEGGTNLEEAMNLAYQTAARHYSANGINRVVLLTDGAANLGDTEPEALKKKVEANRKQGIALDCFGIGWEGYNDDLLEVLTRNGDGRYGFLNTPEAADTEFAGQLAGALHVAASDVKVQVEFNTNRVTAYRQIGYARHQLTKQQFRDNTVDAAEIGVAESGNALYVVETNPRGEGPLATIRVRYKVPGTVDYHEQEWTVPFTGAASPLEQGSPAMRLATTAASFSEWLANNPYAGEVTSDRLLSCLSGVPGVYGADPRPQKLEWMIRQAKALSGK